jgi:helix-turn-helix protein
LGCGTAPRAVTLEMADIGSTLRETRIRNKIDISTVEDATKIRAKYLRALENEEWVVLPGPTYVKTFLRTYAQYLGLDPHLLVEEYSARFEDPEELELPAFSHEPRLRTRVQRVGPPSWLTTVGVLALAFLAFLLVLGLTGNNGGDGKSKGSGAREARQRHAAKTPPAATKPAAAHIVSLEVVAARPVWVCLVDSHDKQRVEGRTLKAGDREGPFRSSSFRVTVGNGGGDLRIDGKRRDTPDRAEPVGYLVKPGAMTVLAANKRPTCG